MPKQIKQVAFIYLISNSLLLITNLVILGFDIIQQTKFTCYRSLGSFSEVNCDLLEYAYEYLFYTILTLVMLQSILIPAALITLIIGQLINIKSKLRVLKLTGIYIVSTISISLYLHYYPTFL